MVRCGGGLSFWGAACCAACLREQAVPACLPFFLPAPQTGEVHMGLEWNPIVVEEVAAAAEGVTAEG